MKTNQEIATEINRENNKAEWVPEKSDNVLYEAYKCSRCENYIMTDSFGIRNIGFTIHDMIYCNRCGRKMKVAKIVK